jgi:hypothetical protein
VACNPSGHTAVLPTLDVDHVSAGLAVQQTDAELDEATRTAIVHSLV